MNNQDLSTTGDEIKRRDEIEQQMLEQAALKDITEKVDPYKILAEKKLIKTLGLDEAEIKTPKRSEREKGQLSSEPSELRYVARKFNVTPSFVLFVKEELNTTRRVKIYTRIKELINDGITQVVYPRIDW